MLFIALAHFQKLFSSQKDVTVLDGFRHITWEEYGRLVARLAESVKTSGRDFDLVIGIARGGIPVAMVVADELGVKIDIINVKSYTGISERSKPRILSTLTEEVRGKKLLLVDDLVDEGDTMESIAGYLARSKPSSLVTAVIFTKPWSKLKPDFSVEEVNEWVVFPWEKGEVSRLRAKQPFRKIALKPSP